jgi:acyl-CoA synthetase (AMP-forming)/AMP-acid ligase II
MTATSLTPEYRPAVAAPPTAPGFPTTLGDIARCQARDRPDAVAFVFESRLTTYAAFDRHTNQVAWGLLALGAGPRVRVAYLGKNSDHYFELLFGAAKAGAVMVPVNWRLAGPEIGHIVADSGAAILFVDPEFADLAAAAAPGAPALRQVILMGSGSDSRPGYAAWRDAQDHSDPACPVTADFIAVQLYTSGTTGRPKGAMLRHANLLALSNMQSVAAGEWTRWTSDDVSLVAMPVAHIGGTGWGTLGLYHGAKGVVLREFEPGLVLDAIEHQRISKLFLVPAAMQIMVRLPRAGAVDYSALKYMMYGASPIPLALLRECMAVFGCGFVQMYGMTETSGAIVALDPEDHSPEGSPRMRSAGRPLQGVEIAILDAEGKPLPPNRVGEVATRSRANMAGYWKLPDATAQTIDAENWLRTGDAGYLDEDGYLYIHDRVKDMIISGGENIYPAEVENAIFGHPQVADVAVIGVPDENWGEAVKALVVPRPGAAPDPAEIIAWARSRIAGFKVPKSLDFIDCLPRNASGKILRRALREPYWAGRERRVN